MPTLQDRLAEIMRVMNWQHADLVRVSGQSSSVVSQWRGKSSKLIKSIGSLDAAQRIEAASGYCALWVAKGQGPKLVARENRAAYGAPQLPDQWGARMAALTPEQLTALQSAVEAMLSSYENARAAKPGKRSAAGSPYAGFTRYRPPVRVCIPRSGGIGYTEAAPAGHGARLPSAGANTAGTPAMTDDTWWLVALMITSVGVIVLLAWGLWRILFPAKGKPMVCTTCGHHASPKTATRGSFLIELVLWLMFLVPGLIYSLWRLSTRQQQCAACGGTALVPPDTPAGKKLLREHAASS